jgi:stage III sporulation protein AE
MRSLLRRLLLPFLLLMLLGGSVLAAGPPTAQPVGSTPPASSPTTAPADQRDSLLAQQAQNLDTHALDSFLREINRTWDGYGPQISLKDFIDVYKGGNDSKYSPKVIMTGLLRYLVREVLANAGLLAKLVVLAIVAAVLQNMQSAFTAEATGKVAHAVVYLVLVGLAITGFGIAVSTAQAVMEQLDGFMLAMLPTLLAVLAGMGGLTSAAIFHPLMVTFTSTAAQVMVTVVFPLIFLSAILDIVSGLSENFKLTNLAGLMRQGAMYTMGLTFTIFLGVVAVKGAAGAVADGLTMKTTKFVVSNFVPVVGKMFSDAADLIFGSSILLKNALGMAGLAAIFFIAAFPLLKILSLVVVYQLAGALVEPVGATQIAKMLNTMAKSLQLVFASVAVVTLMFFVGITVIVGAGNLSVMVR